MPPAVSARTACRTGFARCFRPRLMTDDRRGAVPTDRSPAPDPAALAGKDGVGPEDDTLWTHLRSLTTARIGLKRTGASLATGPLLGCKLAHPRARDAVREPLDEARLIADIAALGLPVLAGASAAEDRQRYLMRPDLGRRLALGLQAALPAHGSGFGVVFVLSVGLCARA